MLGPGLFHFQRARSSLDRGDQSALELGVLPFDGERQRGVTPSDQPSVPKEVVKNRQSPRSHNRKHEDSDEPGRFVCAKPSGKVVEESEKQKG